jgi:hypothetical protein
MKRSGLALPLVRTLLLAMAVTGSARRALADEPLESKARQAQALFDRGRDLMATGDVEQACPLLAESQRLDPGGGTLLNLAVCHEKQGRLATAWSEYHDALSASLRDDRKDRQALANERIRALDGRLPHLVVELPADWPADAAVLVDGAELSKLAASTPLPIDPGPHEVTAAAPGRTTWSTRLAAVAEGESVRIQVPPLVLVPQAPPLASSPVLWAPPTPSARLSTGSYVAGGVALAAWAAMGITGGLALGAQSSADKVCNTSRDFCSDPSGPGDASRAVSLAWVSTISLGVALAATAAAVLWPRARSGGPARGAAQTLELALDMTSGRWSVRGSF